MSDFKNAWFSIFDASLRQSEREQLIYLKGELAPPATFDNAKIDHFSNLLVKHQDDTDLLHEILMQIDPKVVAAMYKRDSAITRQLLERFVLFTSQQPWGFSYTDRIGNFCRALFDLIADYEIRALLIYCVLEVGAEHHRFHVLGIFSDLIMAPKLPGEDLAIRDRLERVKEWNRRIGARYVNLAKLPEALKPLFAFSGEE